MKDMLKAKEKFFVHSGKHRRKNVRNIEVIYFIMANQQTVLCALENI